MGLSVLELRSQANCDSCSSYTSYNGRISSGSENNWLAGSNGLMYCLATLRAGGSILGHLCLDTISGKSSAF